MKCPRDEQLLRGLLGELTVNEAQAIERHSSSCPRCALELDSQRALLSDLSVRPRLPESEDAFTQSVLSAVRRERSAEAARRPEWRSGGRARALVIAAAVAASALLATVPGSAPSAPTEHFAARGGSTKASREPRAELFFVRAGVFAPLAGALLRAGDALAARVSNRREQPAYLALFAIDASGTVHWLYPAYVDPGTTPESITVAPETRDRLLDEVVEPETPAPGSFRVFALFSPAPLGVLAIEARRSAFMGAAPSSPFPGTDLQQWSCTWLSD
jgi:hypothetical protein